MRLWPQVMEIAREQTKPVTTYTKHMQEPRPVLRNSRTFRIFWNNKNTDFFK